MTDAVVDVLVEGRSIAARLGPLLRAVRTRDRAGSSSDTASLEIDDPGPALRLPEPGRRLEVRLGWRATGAATVFAGTVDRVHSDGSRAGRLLRITAGGFDTAGPAKARRSAVYRDATLGEIMRRAGAAAGVGDVRVAPRLAELRWAREVQDNESFVELGERLARETGGTFKLSQDRAVLALRGSGETPGGRAMPTVRAAWGENLHSWTVTPFAGRSRFRRCVVRFYDAHTATWERVEVETGLEGADVEEVGRFTAPDRDAAEAKARALKTQAQQRSGAGRVVIEGDPRARAEGVLVLAGARPGVDGRYRIEGVEHAYARGSGFVTTLELAHPLGA